MRWIRPFEGEDRLALPSDADASTDKRGLTSYEGLDVVLPQLVQGQRPSQAIQLPPAAEPAFVHDPPERFEAATESGSQQPIAGLDAFEVASSRHEGEDVTHTKKKFIGQRDE